jgi:prephenate dehydrogenase
MTEQEHKLVMAMFTVQHHLISTLVDVLKSNDLLTDDDLEAFAAVNFEMSTTESAQKIGELYRALARKTGVPLPWPPPPPPE